MSTRSGLFRTVAIVALPISMFFAGINFVDLFYYGAGAPFPNVLTFGSYNADVEAVYRFATATTFIVCASMAVGATMVAVHVLVKAYGPCKTVLTLCVGLFIAAISHFLGDDGFSDIVVSRITVDPTAPTPATSAVRRIQITGVTNALIAIASIALFFATTTLWFKDDCKSTNTIGEKAVDMTDRLFTLKRLILMASGICLTGTLLFNSWTKWPLGFLDPLNGDMKKASEIYRSAVNGLVLYNSSVFFLTLAFGFLPTLIWIRAQNRKLFSGHYDDEDPRIKENREAFSNVFWLPLPILAPFVVVLEDYIKSSLGDIGGGP